MQETKQLRQMVLAEWVKAQGGHQSVVNKFKLSQSRASYLSQCVNGDGFGERAAANWEESLRLPEGMLVNAGNWQSREKIPPTGMGTPGATGYTTDVNPNTLTGGHGQIWHLPLIPMDRIELAREPNMTAVIEDLPKYPAAYGGAPYDTEQDKVLILEMDVDGTTAKRGHVAIFRPVNGRRIKQTNRPVLVKNERGDHVLMSYGAFAGMHGAELVAVCIHNYEPMDESPFV